MQKGSSVSEELALIDCSSVEYMQSRIWSKEILPIFNDSSRYLEEKKKSKRKVQGVPQSQTAALPRPQEEEKTDKSKQTQTEQTYEKH